MERRTLTSEELAQYNTVVFAYGEPVTLETLTWENATLGNCWMKHDGTPLTRGSWARWNEEKGCLERSETPTKMLVIR